MISTKTSALKRNWYNNPIKEYVVLLVFVLLFFNMFSFSYNKTLSAIADVSFLLCGLLSVMRIFLSKKLSHTDYGITLCFGAILLLKAISGILLGQYLTIVKVALRLSICEMLIVFIPKEKKILYFSRIFNILFFVFIVLGFVDYFLSLDKIKFELFGSMNTFAAIFMVLLLVDLLIISLVKKRSYLINCIMAIVLIFLLKSRTPLLVLIIISLMYFVLFFFKRKASTKPNIYESIMFDLIMVLGIVAIGVYINIADMPFYQKINELSLSLFGKNIDSGRPLIWKTVIDNMSGHLLFGVGNVRELFDGDYSAHSQFIQILGDNGLIGLIVFLIIFRFLWKEAVPFRFDSSVRLYLACIIGLMIYNCFEVSLIENKFALGCFEWILFAIGRYRVNYLKNQLPKFLEIRRI